MSKSKFQTIVEIPEFSWKTEYQKRNLFMGSCFTENIGNRMSDLKYEVDINPFGILYNPMSVASGLEILLDNKEFEADDVHEHNGLWQSFAHHGNFSSTNKTQCLANINTRIKSSSEFLKSSDFLFLTFGTAWVYRHKKSGKVVSNCHKIPAKEFVRERLSVNDIVEKYMELFQQIWEVNPSLKVVFTVSPIRHWKDGAIENQRSKSTLLLAIEQLINMLGNDKCAYFPSYEIVMDELRDYRFYAEDMLHLTDVAVKHIWGIFENSLINEESIKNSREIQKIISAVRHRPINRKSIEFYKFLISFQKKIEELEAKLPFLNLMFEKEYFNVQCDKFNQNKDNF